jgi:predicted GTPase
MGYGDEQLADLEATIRAVPCDVVVTGTPMDLSRIIEIGHPVRHAAYESVEVGEPQLEKLLAEVIEEAWLQKQSAESIEIVAG